MPVQCPNCGERVTLNFCPSCGQATADRRGPVLGLLGDFFSEFLSLDGRHVRTFFRLWIPGELTRHYLEGRRASYPTPVRVYFVASLLFFLLVGFPAPDAARVNVYVNDVLIGRDEPGAGLAFMRLGTDDRSSWLGRRISPLFDAKLEALRSMPAQELLDKFYTRLERTVSTTLIGLVPFVALGLALIFFRQPFFYVDHLVFALHVQSFLFMLFVLARLANVVALERFVPAALTYILACGLIMPIYLLLAVKRVYRQSWPWSVIKSAAIGLLYLVVIQPILLVTMYFVIRGM